MSADSVTLNSCLADQPEANLWLAVIKQAIVDYRAGMLHRIYFYSREFQWLCGLIDVDATMIREKLKTR